MLYFCRYKRFEEEIPNSLILFIIFGLVAGSGLAAGCGDDDNSDSDTDTNTDTDEVFALLADPHVS